MVQVTSGSGGSYAGKITVNSIEGLQSYATSIEKFSSEYQSAVNTVKRDLTNKVTGAQNEAIKAFFDKIDQIQSNVFDTLPDVLTEYQEVVETYHAALTDFGFQTKVYSDASDAEEVAGILTGEQQDAVTSITEKLQKTFQQAADAMGTIAESVSSIDNAAESSLSEAASKRTTTDTQIQAAFSAFKSGLSAQTEKLNSLKSVLDTASNVTSVPLKTVFQAISKGYLTADEMYYFDAVKSKEDAKAFHAVIGDDLGQVMEVDPEKISEGMSGILATEMSQWIAENRTDRISILFNQMGNTPINRVSQFTEKMLLGGDAQAIATEVTMAGFYESGDMTSVHKLNQKLTMLNSLNGLMETMNVMNIGTSSRTWYSSGSQYTNNVSYSFSDIEIDVATGNVSFYSTKHQTTGLDETSKFDSNFEATYAGYDSQVDFQKLHAITEKRAQAKAEFAVSLAGLFVDGAISFVPGGQATKSTLTTMKNVFSGLLEGNAGDTGEAVLSYIADGETDPDARIKKIEKFSSAGNKFITYYQKLQSNLSQLNQEELKTRATIINNWTDSGGWYLMQQGEVVEVSFEHYHDFSALMREMYLDEHGLSEFLSDKEMEELVSTIENSPSDNINFDSNVLDYLSGNSNLELSKMSSEQLSFFNSILSKVKTNNDLNIKNSTFLEKIKDLYDLKVKGD